MKKIAALVMAMSLVCSAATVYVDAGASGANDGTSWTNAYTSLSTAISSATAGDELWVKSGTYKPGSTRPDTFLINKTLSLYGGFDGTETMEAQRNPATNVTTLSGDIGTANDKSDNSYTVITLSSGTVVVDGFTIRDGKSQTSSDSGAGLRVSTTSVNTTIKNCKFIGNEAGNSGGAGGGAAVITPFVIEDCSFSQNSAGSGGGLQIAVNGNSGNALVKDSSFLYNSAENLSGGAIRISVFTGTLAPVINNCSFITNTSPNIGGAISSSTSTSVVGSTFLTNSTGNFGGAFYGSGVATITSCTFDGNNATSGNGGAVYASKAATIDRCYFTFNSAYYAVAGNGMGGALSLTSISDNDLSVISNSIFWGNFSDIDGAAAHVTRNTKFANCTFLENDSDGYTIFRDGTRSLTIYNSIIWGNYSVSGEVNSFSSLTIQYTDIEGGWTGTGNINSDPLLTTDFPDTLNWWPDTGSPALEAGNDSLIVGSSDIVGNTRDVGTVDMGAIEKQ